MSYLDSIGLIERITERNRADIKLQAALHGMKV